MKNKGRYILSLLAVGLWLFGVSAVADGSPVRNASGTAGRDTVNLTVADQGQIMVEYSQEGGGRRTISTNEISVEWKYPSSVIIHTNGSGDYSVMMSRFFIGGEAVTPDNFNSMLAGIGATGNSVSTVQLSDTAQAVRDYADEAISEALQGLAGAIIYKGQVATMANLPSNPAVGDEYLVITAADGNSHFAIWDGGEWDITKTDLSNFYTKTDVDTAKVHIRTEIGAKADTTYVNGSTFNAASATKLKTARQFKINLAQTVAQPFDGTADAQNIGVSGTLPIANGGTGQTSASTAITALLGANFVNYNGTLPLNKGGTGAITAAAAATSILGTNFANYTGILPVAKGGTDSDNPFVAHYNLLNGTGAQFAVANLDTTVLNANRFFSFTSSSNKRPENANGQGFSLAYQQDKLWGMQFAASHSKNSYIRYHTGTNVYSDWERILTTASTVAVANGGTGATAAPAARTNLDVYSKAEVATAITNALAAAGVTFTSRATTGRTDVFVTTQNYYWAGLVMKGNATNVQGYSIMLHFTLTVTKDNSSTPPDVSRTAVYECILPVGIPGIGSINVGALQVKKTYGTMTGLKLYMKHKSWTEDANKYIKDFYFNINLLDVNQGINFAITNLGSTVRNNASSGDFGNFKSTIVRATAGTISDDTQVEYEFDTLP